MVPDSPIRLSVVIPVYGSELVLKELTARLLSVLGSLPSIRDRFEIIFVCDQSPDESWQVIKGLASVHSAVQGILLRINVGQHNAIMAGITAAQGEIIVTMDDDLQHSPTDIPKLLAKMQMGFDVVYANFKSRNHPVWKIAGSRFNDIAAAYFIKKPRGVYLSPFRAMRRAICTDLLVYTGPYVYLDGLILTVTKNLGSVEVEHFERYDGKSGYGLGKSIALWMKMATNFSVIPLRLTTLAGFFFAILGFLLAVVFVVQKLTIDQMPDGWSSLMVAILILGGGQLLALGIVGEYVGRVLLTINSRPQYVVDKRVGVSQSKLNC